MKTTDDKLDFLTGQVAAQTLAIRALLMTHPAKDEAVARFHDEFEQAFSRVLPRAFPDQFVDGLQTVRGMFLEP